MPLLAWLSLWWPLASMSLNHPNGLQWQCHENLFLCCFMQRSHPWTPASGMCLITSFGYLSAYFSEDIRLWLPFEKRWWIKRCCPKGKMSVSSEGELMQAASEQPFCRESRRNCGPDHSFIHSPFLLRGHYHGQASF